VLQFPPTAQRHIGVSEGISLSLFNQHEPMAGAGALEDGTSLQPHSEHMLC